MILGLITGNGVTSTFGETILGLACLRERGTSLMPGFFPTISFALSAGCKSGLSEAAVAGISAPELFAGIVSVNTKLISFNDRDIISARGRSTQRAATWLVINTIIKSVAGYRLRIDFISDK